MSDKPLPTFSFGPPASTSGSTSSSLFGTSSNTGQGLFGSGSSNTGNTGSSLFGNTSGTTGKTQGSLFGNTPATAGNSEGFSLGQTQADTSGREKKSLFGAMTTDSSKPSFSAPSPSGSGQNSPFSAGMGSGTGGSGGFGGFNFLQTPAKPSASTETSSTTPAPNSITAFGNQSTTPAGAPPPAPAIFGQSTGANALSIFGKQPSQTAVSTSTGTQSTTGPNLFGNKSSGFSFTPSPSSAQTGPLNATTTAQTASSLFGSSAQTTTSSAPIQEQKSIFSGLSGGSGSGLDGGLGGGDKGNFPVTASTNTGQQPASSNIFGRSSSAAPPTSSATTTASAPAPPFFQFPKNPPASSTGPTSSAPALPTFAWGSTSTPTSSAGAATSAPTPSPFRPPPTTTNTTTTSAPTPAPFGPPPTTSNISITSAPVPSPFGLPPTSSASQAANSTFASNISSSGPPPLPQSRLKNKTMDEILTRWASDLTKYTKEFRSYADTVSHWDQVLVENLHETQRIYAKTVTSEKQMQSVEVALSAVEKQQDELEGWLSRYEKDVDEMMAKNNVGQGEMGGPDQERERTYKLAERLGERLDDMGRDLIDMIEEVNTVTATMSRNGGRDEPITQIVKILNSHLTQLQEIDHGTAVLQAKVTSAQSAATQMGYSNGTSNGDGRAAVEDFYRSYMGRR